MQPLFLLIDDNRDGRSVISRAVQRKYGEALRHDFPLLQLAAGTLRSLGDVPHPWIAVVGRTPEHDTPGLVAAVRAIQPRIPVIALGRNEEAHASLAAGADQFLDYEAWLLLGVMVERITAALAGGGAESSARRTKTESR